MEQMTLFPERRGGGAADAEGRGPDGRRRSQAAGLVATSKRTLNMAEAAAALGATREHVKRLIEDGTLLAVDVGRDDEALGAERPGAGRRRSWRVVSRLGREAPAGGKLLTLEEFVSRRSSENG